MFSISFLLKWLFLSNTENKRIAFDFAKNGIPSNAIANGYTIDVNGYVYSCINQASQIWQIDPE